MGDAREVFDGWNRKWRTLWCWSQLYIGYKAAQAKGRLLSEDKRDEFWEQKHSYLAEMVWTNISELRGWWVKVGQFLSTRSDLLPAQYIKHLVKLQDMMPTSAFPIVKQIVEEELGKPLTDVFDYFEEKALASASIAQVHKARLIGSNQFVVVKVQHPGVDKTLRQDMMTLTQMTWAFGMLEKSLNVGPILEEWQKAAGDELDFRVELRHQTRAREAALKSGIDIIIPRCYPDVTTQKIMVMEYCEGFKITDTEKLKKYHVDTSVLMTKICKSFAYQIHVDGMFNGDPHPGNILVQIHPITKEPTPVLLDWGLVKSFNQTEKVAFAKAVYCVANMDVMGLMAAFEDMGFRFKTDSVIDPELYMDALRIGFFRDTGADNSETKQSAVSVVKESGVSKQTVIEKNPIDDWPKDIIFFVRVASLLHGLCLQLDAKVPFLQLLVDRAEQCLFERYIPPSPLVYIRYPAMPGGKIQSTLEWKIHRFLQSLLQQQLLLGCQVAIFKDNRLVADVCVGQMGPTNTKPVQRDTLFPLMTVCNGLLATSLLKLVDRKELSLDDPVCHWWDGFIRFGKHHVTIRDTLCHRGGLHAALPRDLTLTALTDYERMISILEDASLEHPYGEEGGRYAYLTSGWVLSEVIRGVSSLRIDEFFQNEFIRRLGLANEMFYPVSKALLIETRKLSDSEHTSQAQPTIVSLPGSPSSTPLSSLQHLTHQEKCSTVQSDVSKTLYPLNNKHRILSETELSVPHYQHTPSIRSPTTETTTPKVFTFEMGLAEELELRRTVKQQLKRESITPTVKQLSHPYKDHASHTTQSRSTILIKTDGVSQRQHLLKHDKIINNIPVDSIEHPINSTYYDNNQVMHTYVYPRDQLEEQVTFGNLSKTHLIPRHLELHNKTKKFQRISLPDSINPLKRYNDEHLEQQYRSSSPAERFHKKGNRRGDELLKRFTSTCRAIGVAKITNEEVTEKLEQARRAAGLLASQLANANTRYPSKYLHKIQELRQIMLKKDSDVRGTAIQLAKAKPHVLDPLIYDSRRLHHLLIPPTNCRATARALGRFYAALASGKLISAQLLKEASQILTIDASLDTLILTGGGSRIWGLGYQLYPCCQLGDPVSENLKDIPQKHTIIDEHSDFRRVMFAETKRIQQRGSTESQQSSKIIMGLGHGDMSGNVGLCFPEMKLSIAILLNDILTGPQASQQILTFILNCFGLDPAWDIPYPIEYASTDIDAVIKSRAISNTTTATVALKREHELCVDKVIPSCLSFHSIA